MVFPFTNPLTSPPSPSLQPGPPMQCFVQHWARRWVEKEEKKEVKERGKVVGFPSL